MIIDRRCRSILLFATCMGAFGLLATGGLAQPAPTNQPTTIVLSKDDLDKITERANEALRTAEKAIEKAESARDVADRRFETIDKIFLIGSAIATMFLALLGYAEAQRRKTEQERFDVILKRQDRFDEVAFNAAGQQARMTDTQIELGNRVLSRSDEVLQGQIDTMTKFGAVIALVEKIYKGRQEREEGQGKVQEQLDKFMATVERLTTDAQSQLENLVIAPTLTLRELTRLDWPTLGAEERTLAAGLRITFRNVSGVAIEEATKKDPLQIAEVCYLLGVSAFYANDIAESLRLLQRSRELYDSITPVPAEHRKPAAFCFHYLGLVEKNWWRATIPLEENFQEAKRYLGEADRRLKDSPREFLTPLTLIEVLSYIEAERKNARARLSDIINRFETIPPGELNANQRVLRQRAYLLEGNLAFFEGNTNDAIATFKKATNGGSGNHFALLSMGQMAAQLGMRDDALLWLREGLSQLVRSGALEKLEMTNRGSNLAWAAIAAHLSGDGRKVEYANKLFQEMNHVRKVGNRVPLFFDPVTKVLVTADTLVRTVQHAISIESNVLG